MMEKCRPITWPNPVGTRWQGRGKIGRDFELIESDVDRFKLRRKNPTVLRGNLGHALSEWSTEEDGSADKFSGPNRA